MAGRPREFDEAEVLDRAVELFWKQGYEGTSLHEVLKHTGLSRQSLYNTFGDKHQLFLRALDRYRDTRGRELIAGLRRDDAGFDAVREFLEGLAHLSAEGPCSERRACFVTNSAVELAPHDERVAAAVQAHVRTVEHALRHALEGAIAAGQLGRDTDVDACASYLTTVAQGLLVMGKAGASRRKLQRSAKLALSALT